MLSKIEKLILLALILMAMLPGFATDIYAPSMPHMVGDLQTNQADVQMTMTIYMLGFALATPFVGLLSDRFGRRPVLFSGFGLYTFAAVLCAFAVNIEMVFLGRCLQAIGGSCGTVVTRAVVKDRFQGAAQLKAMTYVASGVALAPIIAPILGGVLEQFLHWRASFIFMALLSGIALCLMSKYLEETNLALNYDALNVRKISRIYFDLVRNKHFWVYTLMISFGWLAYFSFLTSASFIFQDGIGLSALEFGAIFSFMGFGFIGGTFVARRLLVTFHYDVILRKTSYFNLFCAVTLFVPAIFGFLNVPVVLIPMIFFALSLGIIFPTTQAALADHFPHIIGIAFGLFFFIEMMFGFIGSFISSSVHENNQLALSVIILSSAVLMVCSFRKLKKGLP